MEDLWKPSEKTQTQCGYPPKFVRFTAVTRGGLKDRTKVGATGDEPQTQVLVSYLVSLTSAIAAMYSTPAVASRHR
ncbi:hypothetical protein F5B19DRAFT_488708 [Rostrohypoxylon terebratum]|nr:hypothetical protein F5B19DRAFT_488708 [Rostrohypoxylon terebratum]